ncbi:MAG TPA: hypothetical protein PKD76_10300 [Solirubrobacterales bacterium]|nr:hypothetical protein [Solirubrobacterales bacterium]
MRTLKVRAMPTSGSDPAASRPNLLPALSTVMFGPVLLAGISTVI